MTPRFLPYSHHSDANPRLDKQENRLFRRVCCIILF